MTKRLKFPSFLSCCVSSSAPMKSNQITESHSTTDYGNQSEGPLQPKTQSIATQPEQWFNESYEKLQHENAQLEKELNEARKTIRQHEERLLIYSNLRLSNMCTPLKFNSSVDLKPLEDNECPFHDQGVPSVRTDLSHFQGC